MTESVVSLFRHMKGNKKGPSPYESINSTKPDQEDFGARISLCGSLAVTPI